MKRIIAIFSVIVILLFICAPFCLASSTLPNIESSNIYYFNFPQPVQSHNIFYIIYNIKDSPHAYITQYYIPLLTQEQLNSGEVDVFLTLLDDGYTIQIIGSLKNADIYSATIRDDGVLTASGTYSTDSNGEFMYTNRTYLPGIYTYFNFFDGNFKIVPSNYRILRYSFMEDKVIVSLMTSIIEQLNNIYSQDSNIYTAVNTKIYNIIQSFYSRNHSDLTNINAKLITVNSYLQSIDGYASDISEQLDTIIQILGGNDVITTIPPDTELNNDISDYHEAESEQISNFDEALSDFDSQINNTFNIFDNFSDAFTFIKVQFQNFTYPYGYVVLTISLVFGIIVLVLGRSA